MDGLLGIGFIVGFIVLMIAIAVIGSKFIDWRYDKKEKKFLTDCPQYEEMKEKYLTLRDKFYQLDDEVKNIEKEIDKHTKELNYSVVGLREKESQKIESLKAERLNIKIQLDKISAETKEQQQKIVAYLTEKNYLENAKNWNRWA